MADTVSKLLEHLDRVLAREGEVAGVEAQEHILGVGVLHQAGGLLDRLAHGAHVVMEAGADAVLLHGQLAQLVHAVGKAGPFLVGQHALVLHVEDRGVQLALDGAGLLGYVDRGRADVGQVLELLDELSLDLFVRLVNQERGEPLGRDRHVAHVEHVLEDFLVLRVLVADFAAVKARELHLGNALLERVLVAQIPHIIVGPTDRADAQLYFLRI